MKCEERRSKIIRLLADSDHPISASVLANKFNVSRQIIVKDIATIRKSGTDITSLSRGYVLYGNNPFEKVFKTIHSDEDSEKELNLIVDLGGIIKDVFIYHKVYGVVSAPINIKTREDVQNFIKTINEGKSSLLKNVTGGFHYHTVKADTVENIIAIEAALKENGFLAPLKKFEPENMLH